MDSNPYVHGYSQREGERLLDQASALTELLHHDTKYPPNVKVLEAGCGIGAQTVILAQNSPGAHFTSIDISNESVLMAESRIRSWGIRNVVFQTASIFDLPFAEESFDHIFVCFVLEHLPNPIQALQHLKHVLKKGGSITVIEGDHGSTYFYPENTNTDRAIDCLVEMQKRSGGNALIGRQLYPLLRQAGYQNPSVSPRMVYVDSSRPDLVEGFTRNTFTAMVEGVREPAIKAGLITKDLWEDGIQGLYRTTEADGVFCYTFFKAIAFRNEKSL